MALQSKSLTPKNIRTGKKLLKVILVSLTALILSNCSGFNSTPHPMPTTPALAKELFLYNWTDYMPQPVLDAFEKEYGTRVIIQTYESQDEAIEKIINGTVTYDIAVIRL